MNILVKGFVFGLLACIIVIHFSCAKSGEEPISPAAAQCAGNGQGPVNSAIPTDGRFAAASIAMPVDGYTDSIFINSLGDRIYFTHSYLTATDFVGLTFGMATGTQLSGHTIGAGLDYNSDLYYIQWIASSSSWSTPINAGSAFDGSQVNSLGNECCMWLDDSETEIIFYRDTFNIPALGPRGNFMAIRVNRDAPWGAPTLLPGDYGSSNQSTSTYRHDIHKTASGDLYLWESNTTAGTATLLYGKKSGSSWDVPVLLSGMESMGAQHNTQPWVSRDELTLLFNTRGPSGDTSLRKMTRPDICSSWENLTTIPITGFSDPSGLAVWGEPTFNRSENYMLFIRFDTTSSGWPVQMMFSPGTPGTSFATPTLLN